MIRIQRRRTPGWRLPEGGVYVGRPTRYGNPWRLGDPVPEHLQRSWYPDLPPVADARAVALLFGDTMRAWVRDDPAFLEPLRGRVLACWCPVGPGTWCHADRILEWFETHPTRPQPGELPVFGLHRMDPDEAATAPVWRTVTVGEREAAYRRGLRSWAKREGVALPVPEEARP